MEPCQAYQEAAKIDEIIGKLLKSNPITKESALSWMNFARVLKTSAEILHEWALLAQKGE